MHKDRVIIPAFNRPEMLNECLERIIAADMASQLEVQVNVDRRRGSTGLGSFIDTLNIFSQFKPRLDIKMRLREEHAFAGNSYNVLTALAEARMDEITFTFLVEDDVMIGKDFFRWHYTVQENEDPFCSIATACTRRNDVPACDDPTKYWTSGSDYASLGVCFPLASLEKIVLHARPTYYRDMRGYIDKHFPTSRFEKEDCEQDGLILRIMGEHHGKSVWPYAATARAFHAGYYGYHRPAVMQPTGTLEERIANFRAIISSTDRLRELAPNVNDILPCSLDGYKWDTLTLEGKFD